MLSLTIIPVDLPLPDSPSLLAQAQRGDAESFCQLCRVHEHALLRQATALCGDSTLAQDLAQETLFHAWKSIGRYQGRCQFFTWLCAILLNRHRTVRRRYQPAFLALRPSFEDSKSGSVVNGLADPNASPDEVTLLGDQAAWLRQCLAKLPPKHREVLHLRFYVDQSLEGIAAALGCSVGTVKSRLYYALERLRVIHAADPSRAKRSSGPPKL